MNPDGVNNPAPRWISSKQAALRLAVSTSLIRKAIRDGRLRPRRVRGARLVRLNVEDVDRLLEEAPPARPQVAEATET